MPRPKQIHEQVINDYKKKIMKAKGNERIRLLLESTYFNKVANNIAGYSSVDKIAYDYFLPKNRKGQLLADVVRERVAELAKFIDDEILLPFDQYREEHPGHSNEWYSNNFAETKAGVYFELEKNMMTPIFMDLQAGYKNAFVGAENEDIYGRKWDKNTSVLSILINEANTARRGRMSPEKVGILEQAEQTFCHGGEAKHIKPVQKEIITTSLDGSLDSWEELDLETDEVYEERQKNLRKNEPKYNLRELASSQWIRFYKGIDYSFIKDDALKKSMKELHQDSKSYDKNGMVLKADYEKNKELFQTLDSFSKRLKKEGRGYWFKPGSYDHIKKSVRNLRKFLVNGETPENRDAILKAYEELTGFCNVYQKKHSTSRKSKTIQKLEIVDSLKNFVDQRKKQMSVHNLQMAIHDIPKSSKRSCSYSELKTTVNREKENRLNQDEKTSRRHSAALSKNQAVTREGNKRNFGKV